MRWIFVTFIISVFLQVTAAEAAELTLEPMLTQELNQVLASGDGLHKALLSRDDERIEINLRDVLTQTRKATAAVGRAKPYERGHLARILESASVHFEISQTAGGEERRKQLAEGFNQLANLARIYKLDPAYSIYFCAKDRATWIQSRGGKVLNPFHAEPTLEHCGIKVSK